MFESFNSNTTGGTSGAGTTYTIAASHPSSRPVFNGFLNVAQSVVFC